MVLCIAAYIGWRWWQKKGNEKEQKKENEKEDIDGNEERPLNPGGVQQPEAIEEVEME